MGDKMRIWEKIRELFMGSGRANPPCCRKVQGSIEYIMMLSAVSIIIVVALAMMTQLKGAAIQSFFGSGNVSITSKLASQLQNLSRTAG